MSDTSDIENAQKNAELILSKLKHSQGEGEMEMSVKMCIRDRIYDETGSGAGRTGSLYADYDCHGIAPAYGTVRCG